MRISDNRYRRDLQSLKIAMCFLAYEARTQTIRRWTGLSGDRIRKLYREYTANANRFIARRRGKSPHQVAYFWDTTRVRQEATWLASLLMLLGVIKRDQNTSQGESFPNLDRAELLCRAYGIYQSMIPSSQISFEHAVFLARVLCDGNQIRLGTCPNCGGLVIVDPLSIHDHRCNQCS